MNARILHLDRGPDNFANSDAKFDGREIHFLRLDVDAVLFSDGIAASFFETTI